MNRVEIKDIPFIFQEIKVSTLNFSFDDKLYENISVPISDTESQLTRDQVLSCKIYSIFCTNCSGMYNIDISVKTKLCKNCKIPRGLCVIKSALSPKNLDMLYRNLVYHTNHTVEKLGIEINIQEDGKRIFYWQTGFNFLVKLLRVNNPSLIPHLNILMSCILSGIRVKKSKLEYFKANTRVNLVRYESRVGIHTHVDNIKRGGEGPIFSISVGPDQTLIDYVPLKTKYGEAVRFPIEEGQFVAMSGPSRYDWTHSIPNNIVYKKNGKEIKYRFAILFQLPNIGVDSSFYSDFWGDEIGYHKICE